MDAYCPRCRTSITSIDPQTAELGTCPTCSGQLTDVDLSGDKPAIDGAVAMTFNTDTRVGAPLQANYDESNLSKADGPNRDTDDRLGRWDETTPPPSIEGAPKPALRPSVEPAGAASEPASEQVSSSLPAHLQLPNIDFSLPDMGSLPSGTSDSSASGSSGSSGSGSPLPAHLALPEFPAFELPPIPGVTVGKDNVEIRAADGGGSFGGAAPSAGSAQASSGADNWSVTPAATLPPPPPRPPPRRAAPKAAAPAPSLPDFGLPMLAQEPQKSSVTLVESPAGHDSEDFAPRRGWLVVVVVLLLVLAGGVGGAYWRRDDVMRFLGLSQKVAPQMTRTDRAMEFYVRGFQEAQASRHAKAIGAFKKALTIDPTLARAERGLAISYATLKEQEKAVEHYRRYLKLDPKSDDAADVRKIISDYEKAKEAKGNGKSRPRSSR